MRYQNLVRTILSGSALMLCFSCATAPKPASDRLTEVQAKSWLARYCSAGPRELSGSLVLQANTREFKGQHPASVHFEPSGRFTLEVTHILGGTLLRLSSDGISGLDSEIPSRPKLNRKGVKTYMGLEMPVLRDLLQGDLPCPKAWKAARIELNGPEIRISSGPWRWTFFGAIEKDQRIPYRITLSSGEVMDPNRDIDLKIEEWDEARHFAKKVRIHTSEGDLKWIWRDRNS